MTIYMNKLLRVGLHTVYVFGLLLIILLSGGKYDWMTEMDPSIPAGAIEDGSGNSAVFSGLLLAFIIAAQLIIAVKTKRKWEKWVSGFLVLLAILVCAVSVPATSL